MMKAEKTVDVASPEVSVQVPIEYVPPDAARWANQMVVQADKDCIYLHFFQVRPPMFTEEMAKQGIEALQGLKVAATPVVSIAVPIDRAEAMAGAIQKHLEKIGRQFQRSGDDA